ncbi:MAG: aldo/keto reductase [Clostridiales bacterium]|nr:aldo/keto reductase [Clostridiales bacterium]
MKRIDIAGIAVSELMLGAGGRGPAERDELSFAIMDRYVELGGNCFDTARLYADGQSDQSLGRWLRSRGLRDRVVVVTKGSHPDPATMHRSRLSPAEIEGDLDQSLAAIGIDRTDFHLLHRDDPKLPVSEIMTALDRLVRSGKARAVGCSNWTIGRIRQANDFAARNGLAPLAVCQLHHSLAITTAAQAGDVTYVPMSDVEYGWYRESNFPIMAFGAQARGYFSRIAAGQELKPDHLRYYEWIPENRRRADRIQALAAQLGVEVSPLAVAYVLRGGLNAVALCAFSSVAQLEQAVAGTAVDLTPEHIRYLEQGA